MPLNHLHLQNDAAGAGARALLDLVAPVLLPDERKDFLEKAGRVSRGESRFPGFPVMPRRVGAKN